LLAVLFPLLIYVNVYVICDPTGVELVLASLLILTSTNGASGTASIVVPLDVLLLFVLLKSLFDVIVAVLVTTAPDCALSVSTTRLNIPVPYPRRLPILHDITHETFDVGVTELDTNVVPTGSVSEITTPLARKAERFLYDILYVRIFPIYVLIISTVFESVTSASRQSYT
jgi:hypothetical protein